MTNGGSGAKVSQVGLPVDGMYVLIEKYVTGADGALDHVFSGLNGDTDGIYVLEYYGAQLNDGTVDISVRPNGVSENQIGVEQWASSEGTTGIIPYTEMRLVFLGNHSGNPVNGTAKIFPKTGRPRIMRTVFGDYDAGVFYEAQGGSIWNDSVSVINSIEVVSDNPVRQGFTLALYRIPDRTT